LIFAPPALVERFLPAAMTRAVAPGASKKLDLVAVKLVQDQLVLTPGSQMLAAARHLIDVTTDDAYSHVPLIDPTKGIFHADCSELVDYLTQQVKPKALLDLPVDVGHTEPRAWNYYSFLNDQPLVNTAAATGDWARIGKPAELAPGDVIAWKNTAYVPGQGSTGHVMLVSALPTPTLEGGKLVGFDVPVIDSTSHGHGAADPRTASGKNGLGEGTVFFPIDPTGAAAGFSWTPAHTPGAEPPRTPTLAFGRLLP
jgi:hypothetical protein